MGQRIRNPPAERRRAAATAGADATGIGPKRSQRDRLLNAMIELAGRGGYQSVSVAQVSSAAGVSRATFYEQFGDKEDCLLAAWRVAAERLLQEQPPPSRDGEWPDAARSLLRQVAHALQRDPDAGRLLFVEMPTGGDRTRATRRAVLDAFEQRVEEFISIPLRDGRTVDVPPIALVGAMRSIIARYLRSQSEDELAALADDGITWVLSYASSGSERWSTGAEATLAQRPSLPTTEAAEPRPRRLPRGRHGLPAGVIARSQRTRIIHGTAEVMRSKGYENATVADIVSAAGVSRDVFYEHFADKQDAFLEAQQHPTQHILDTCASSYFSAEDWLERVWRTLGSLVELIVANPSISHLRLVECYAAGPDAIRRAEEITRSFTIFLEEGYRTTGHEQELPRLCSLAIAGAIFEIIQRDVRRGDGDGLRARLPQLTYIATAPFVGPELAIARLRELSAGHGAVLAV
ncbi:MAG TPA: TetR/AcrR family transcriptional regulator [Solirubrobacteraceae bacterium]|nr:TetR/AcrR family transcriptional regulator [Solirubrobacteraceae bacterium]